jgi:hypothetical protein
MSEGEAGAKMYAVGSVRGTDLLDTTSREYRSCYLIMSRYMRKIGLNAFFKCYATIRS